MQVKRFVSALWFASWFIALCVLLAGAAAFFISRRVTPLYSASTTLLIQASTRSIAPDYESVRTSESLAQTYAEMIQMRPVLEKVITNLALTEEPEQFKEHLQVAVVRDTQLIVLSVSDSDPERAADRANEIARVFIQQNEEMQASRYEISKQTLRDELTAIDEDISDIQLRLARLDEPATSARRAEADRLQMLLSQYRNTQAIVSQSLEQIRLVESQTTSTVSVVEPAIAPLRPVRPNRLMNVVLAAIAGGAVAVGIVFLREYLNSSVRTSEELQQLTDLPMLAAIATIKVRIGQRSAAKLIASMQEHSPPAESYRVLRTSIELLSQVHPVQSLLITSSSLKDGRTTTVANLAAVTAHSGRRVIIVDADLRAPTLHTFFHLGQQPGLADLLLDEQMSLERCLLPTGIATLRLLPAGCLSADPAALLGSQRMAALLEQLKQQADMIIFDSPPVLALVDAILLARISDAALLVVMAARTPAESIARAQDQFLQAGVSFVGTVFNRVSASYRTYRSYQQHDQRVQKQQMHQQRQNGAAPEPPPGSLPDAGQTSAAHETSDDVTTTSQQ